MVDTKLLVPAQYYGNYPYVHISISKMHIFTLLIISIFCGCPPDISQIILSLQPWALKVISSSIFCSFKKIRLRKNSLLCNLTNFTSKKLYKVYPLQFCFSQEKAILINLNHQCISNNILTVRLEISHHQRINWCSQHKRLYANILIWNFSHFLISLPLFYLNQTHHKTTLTTQINNNSIWQSH
jgi:hypothetical protein